MYLIKNAWKNVIRSKGRNILIFLIVFAITLAATISLTIRQAAETAKTEGLEDTQITAQITFNRQSMIKSMDEEGADRSEMKEKMSQMEGLSLSQLQKYAKSDAVSDFYYSMICSFDSSDVEEISTDTTEDSNMPNDGKNGMSGGSSQGAFSVIGYSSEDAMTDFISGTCKIAEGSMFENDASKKQCIISDELASYNSLKVGDTIELEDPNDSSQTIKLTITGIYSNSASTSEENGAMNQRNPGSDPANQIYTSYAALNGLVKDSDSILKQINGTYVFDDYDAYETFTKDVEEKGLDENYTVTSQDVERYEQSLIPLENLSTFAGYFLVVVFVIGAIVLMVIHIFNIRERKYEIGVLTAIGMKKSKVCIQFVLELFFVTLFAMVIGLGAGSAASVPVSNQLLESQVESQQEQAESVESNFGRGGKGRGDGQETGTSAPGRGVPQQAAQYLSDISASVNMTVILQLFGIGIILTILSSLTAVVFVVRYEPLKILTNRS